MDFNNWYNDDRVQGVLYGLGHIGGSLSRGEAPTHGMEVAQNKFGIKSANDYLAGIRGLISPDKRAATIDSKGIKLTGADGATEFMPSGLIESKLNEMKNRPLRLPLLPKLQRAGPVAQGALHTSGGGGGQSPMVGLMNPTGMMGGGGGGMGMMGGGGGGGVTTLGGQDANIMQYFGGRSFRDDAGVPVSAGTPSQVPGGGPGVVSGGDALGF